MNVNIDNEDDLREFLKMMKNSGQANNITINDPYGKLGKNKLKKIIKELGMKKGSGF